MARIGRGDTTESGARGLNLRSVAQALDGEVVNGHVLAPGPNHSPRDRSLSVLLDDSAPDGFLVKSFAGDDWATCRDHVRERLGLPEWKPAGQPQQPRPRPKPAPRPAVSADDLEQRINRALEIFAESRDPRGTLAEQYWTSRKLPIEDDLAGRVLRFHPSLRFEVRPGVFELRPALVALFRDIHTDKACGIHRTFLDDQGRKLARKMLGRAKDAAIKLDASEDVTGGLAIGEGAETVMAGRLAGFRPAWALGSADAIRTFPVLAGIEALTIFGESDKTGANARAAQACGERWLKAGAEVTVIEPNEPGDLADIWREVAA